MIKLKIQLISIKESLMVLVWFIGVPLYNIINSQTTTEDSYYDTLPKDY